MPIAIERETDRVAKLANGILQGVPSHSWVGLTPSYSGAAMRSTESSPSVPPLPRSSPQYKGELFMTIEDETGVAQGILWPDRFEV